MSSHIMPKPRPLWWHPGKRNREASGKQVVMFRTQEDAFSQFKITLTTPYPATTTTRGEMKLLWRILLRDYHPNLFPLFRDNRICRALYTFLAYHKFKLFVLLT